MKSVLFFVSLLTCGCAAIVESTYWEAYTGYSIKDGPKEDGSVSGVRWTWERPFSEESRFWVGGAVEGNFTYTEDAFENHNYDLREGGGSTFARVGWNFVEDLHVYLMPGVTVRAFDADSGSASGEEVQPDLRAGLRWGDYFIEYRGSNTEYEDKANGNDCIMQWLNTFSFGIRF